MIHSKHTQAEIGDSVAWNIGCRYFIGRVNDWHRNGLVLRLGGKFQSFDWDYFEEHSAVVIPDEDIRRLCG
jgi:hypothetical protein